MFLRQCPFCENVNPPNSKFCNACGVRLHAALCPHCGAVNVLSATACVNCAAELVETLHAVVCPQCGEANDPQATVCAQCAAELRLPGPRVPVDSRGAAKAPARLASPGLPGADLEHGLSEPPLLTDVGEASPAPFSVHFDRDQSVKIDRHHEPDTSHLGARHLEDAVNATLAHPVPTRHLEASALVAQASDRFAHTVPPGYLPHIDAAVPDVAHPRRFVALFGIVILAMLGASAYYLYHEHTLAEMSSLITSSRELKAPDKSSDGAAGDESARVSPSRTAAATRRAAVAPLAVAPTVAATAPPLPAAAEPAKRVSSREQIGAAEAAAAVAAAQARSRKSEATTDRPPQGIGPCTDAVAALGLCTHESTTSRRQ